MAISNALKNGHLEIVEYLLTKLGKYAINIVSVTGDLEVVKYLYETCHADVETKDENGQAQLNQASINGYLDILKTTNESVFSPQMLH